MLSSIIAALLLAVAVLFLFEPHLIVTLARASVEGLAAPFRGFTLIGHLAGQGGFLFQRINRTSPEKAFVVVKNNYATAAITVGQPVIWDFAGAADGISVTKPSTRATNGGIAVAGAVAEASIASAGYGLVQVYGYNSALRMRTQTAGSPALAAGRPLCLPAASAFTFEGMSTASTTIIAFPCGFAITGTTGWTTAVRVGFLKCM